MLVKNYARPQDENYRYCRYYSTPCRGHSARGGRNATAAFALDPAETGELKLTFRDVKRRFFDASTAQVVLETRN